MKCLITLFCSLLVLFSGLLKQKKIVYYRWHRNRFIPLLFQYACSFLWYPIKMKNKKIISIDCAMVGGVLWRRGIVVCMAGKMLKKNRSRFIWCSVCSVCNKVIWFHGWCDSPFCWCCCCFSFFWHSDAVPVNKMNVL